MAEEDGCDGGGGGGGGGTVGVSHVYPNRNVLKDCQARGGGACPWCPPGSATYDIAYELYPVAIYGYRHYHK